MIFFSQEGYQANNLTEEKYKILSGLEIMINRASPSSYGKNKPYEPSPSTVLSTALDRYFQ